MRIMHVQCKMIFGHHKNKELMGGNILKLIHRYQFRTQWKMINFTITVTDWAPFISETIKEDTICNESLSVK